MFANEVNEIFWGIIGLFLGLLSVPFVAIIYAVGVTWYFTVVIIEALKSIFNANSSALQK